MIIESEFTREVDRALEEKDYKALMNLIEDPGFIAYQQEKVETLLELFLDEIKRLRNKVDEYEEGMLKL